MDLISIDVGTYATEAEQKFCQGDQLLLDQLYALADEHKENATTVSDGIPNEISLGLVLVDCRSVKRMLSDKHKLIASKLFEVLERKTREYSEQVVNPDPNSDPNPNLTF